MAHMSFQLENMKQISLESQHVQLFSHLPVHCIVQACVLSNFRSYVIANFS